METVDSVLTAVGYWPKNLFSTLRDHANHIDMGGYTYSSKGDPSPPMGNGQWPGGGSAMLQDVEIFDSNGQTSQAHDTCCLRSNKKCYEILVIFKEFPIFYGGPGGCTS